MTMKHAEPSTSLPLNLFNFLLLVGCRIQKELVDPEKLQATLTEESLAESCGLKRALAMVAILEAQLKEMNPNLDSISEYALLLIMKLNV